MDEFIGRRRLRLRGTVEAVEPGRHIVWRLRKLIPLPARLSLILSPAPEGVMIGTPSLLAGSGSGGFWTRFCGCISHPGSRPTSTHTSIPSSPCCGTTSGSALQPADGRARRRQVTRVPTNPCSGTTKRHLPFSLRRYLFAAHIWDAQGSIRRGDGYARRRCRGCSWVGKRTTAAPLPPPACWRRAHAFALRRFLFAPRIWGAQESIRRGDGYARRKCRGCSWVRKRTTADGTFRRT